MNHAQRVSINEDSVSRTLVGDLFMLVSSWHKMWKGRSRSCMGVARTSAFIFVLAVPLVLAGGDGAASTRTEAAFASSSTLPFDDYMQITDWFSTYASTVDRKKWSTFPDLFTENAFIDYRESGGSHGNVTKMKRWLETVFQFFSASQHLISNIQVVKYIDHRNVEVRAMFFNPMNVVFLPYQPFFTCGGWYNHKFVKMGDGKWRSKYLRVEIAFNNSVWHTTCLVVVLCAAIWYILSRFCCCFASRQIMSSKEKTK